MRITVLGLHKLASSSQDPPHAWYNVRWENYKDKEKSRPFSWESHWFMRENGKEIIAIWWAGYSHSIMLTMRARGCGGESWRQDCKVKDKFWRSDGRTEFWKLRSSWPGREKDETECRAKAKNMSLESCPYLNAGPVPNSWKTLIKFLNISASFLNHI